MTATMTAPAPGPLLSFTVNRRGGPVTFSTTLTLDAAAQILRDAGRASNDFVASLLGAHAAGTISRNQAPWLLLIAQEQLDAQKAAAAAKPAGEFAGLVAAVHRMQSQAEEAATAKGRTAGAVTLRFLGVSVSAVIRGQNAGSLYVKAGGEYLGKIDQAGQFRRAYGVAEGPVLESLRAVAGDPTAAAVAYGRETGACSCCGRKLTNAESIALGIGPICLENLGGALG